MNYVVIGLLAIVLLYLQFHFLSFLNLILIGLLVGTYVAFESSAPLSMIYMLLIGGIILVSMVFKVIGVMDAIDDFNLHIESSSMAPIETKYYLNKDGSNDVLSGMKELDLSKELAQAECDHAKESFVPTEFVEGEEARKMLDTCSNVCAKDKECNLVAMPNVDGKNNECKFYGFESSADDKSAELSHTKTELEELNSTADTMKATHFALVMN